MTRLLSEQRNQAAAVEIKAQVAAKVGVIGVNYKGLAEKVQSLLDKLKNLEANCIKNLVCTGIYLHLHLLNLNLCSSGGGYSQAS